MLVLDSGNKIQGDASVASKVDYTLHGLDNSALKQLADGQLADSTGDLYTADSTDVVAAITLVNTHTSAVTANLYLLPSAGTARRIIPKDVSLGVGYSLIFNGTRFGVYDTNGTAQVPVTSTISDTAYDATSWDGVTTIAPSKNAVRDKIETMAYFLRYAILTGEIRTINTYEQVNIVEQFLIEGTGTFNIDGTGMLVISN